MSLSHKYSTLMGSGCGLVGRAVASDSRGQQFESSHRQYLLCQNCIEKTKIKQNEDRKGAFLKVPNVNDGYCCRKQIWTYLGPDLIDSCV